MGKILVIGYGNPGRQDDGLGPALASAIEGLAIPGVDVDAGYQLDVEDALAVSQHDVVVLADADVSCDPPFRMERVQADRTLGFTSHSVPPGMLVAMAEDLFGGRAEAWILGIRGYRFDEFGEGLSEPARLNLDAAVAALRTKIEALEENR